MHCCWEFFTSYLQGVLWGCWLMVKLICKEDNAIMAGFVSYNINIVNCHVEENIKFTCSFHIKGRHTHNNTHIFIVLQHFPAGSLRDSHLSRLPSPRQTSPMYSAPLGRIQCASPPARRECLGTQPP